MGIAIPLSGSEIVGKVQVDVSSGVITTTDALWKFSGGSFVPQSTFASKAVDVSVSIGQTAPPLFPPDVPFTAVISLDFDRVLMEVAGSIPTSVHFEALAQDLAPAGDTDLTPAADLFLVTPLLPVCEVDQPEVRPGGTITVTSSGLPPNQPTHIFMGTGMGIELTATGTTDGAGNTVDQFQVPVAIVLGDHLITIGIDDGDTAITADCGILVQERPLPTLHLWGLFLLLLLLITAGTVLILRRPSTRIP